MRQQQKDQPIGHEYIVRNKRYKFFVPDIITSVENQINQIIVKIFEKLHASYQSWKNTFSDIIYLNVINLFIYN